MRNSDTLLAMRVLLISILAIACSATPKHTETVATAERDTVLSQVEGAIGGQVSYASDGRALPMAIVQAEQDGKVVADDISDYQGRYRLGPLRPGVYSVSARFAEARIEFKRIVVGAGEQSDLPISLAIPKEVPKNPESADETTTTYFGSIEGIVLDDSDGTVFPGTVVSLVAPHLSDSPMAFSDEEGKFEFRGLRPGKYSLSCYYQLINEGNVEIRQNNIEVSSGQTTKVTLNLDLRIRLQ